MFEEFRDTGNPRITLNMVDSSFRDAEGGSNVRPESRLDLVRHMNEGLGR